MNKKIFNNARFTPKGDIEANWKKAVGFIPLDKEIIIYKADATHSVPRIKIGDGVTGINDLPFVTEVEGIATEDWVNTQAEALGVSLQEYTNNKVQGLASEEYVNEAIAAIPPQVQADYEQNDPAAANYIKNRPFYIEENWVDIINGTYTTTQGGIFYRALLSNFSLTEIPQEIKIVLDQQDLGIFEPAVDQHSYGDDNWYIGNLSIRNSEYGTSYEDTGEPFLITFTKNSAVLKTEITKSTTHTLIMSISMENIVKIDEKYLPDNVVIKSEIDQTYNAESANAQSGIAVAEVENKLNKKLSDIIFDKNSDNITIFTAVPEQELTVSFAGTSFEGLKKDFGDGIVESNEYTFEANKTYTVKIYDAATISTGIFSDGSLFATEFGKSLQDIVIGYGVTAIDKAFLGCTSLKKVEILNNVNTGNAFVACSSLISVTLPNNMESIGSSAFSNCSSLTEIVIPDSVTSIGDNAFFACRSLTEITFKSVTPLSYNNNWFYKCSIFAHIYVPYGCKQAYIDQWTADGAPQDILDKIVESDREAMMSDINSLKSEIQAELVGKTDYLGTVAAMADLSTIAGAGDYHRVSTEFVYDESTGEMAHVGDILIAIIDNPAQTKEYWDLVHTEMGAAPATSDDIANIFNEET